ncbi:MAG: hypothetical protein ABEJ72_00565, partial [Candidatus Aenigmatarchaeota archaeon]
SGEAEEVPEQASEPGESPVVAGSYSWVDFYAEQGHEEELEALLKSSLHGLAFSLMSGHLSPTPRDREWILQDEKNLGDLSEIRGELQGKNPINVDNLLFEVLIRAWYGQEFNETFPDLAQHPNFSEGDERCEFVITGDGRRPQMVEGKKLDCSGNTVRNFEENLEKALRQFEGTKDVLGLEDPVGHHIVDVSRYSNTEIEIDHDERSITIKGVTSEELQDLSERFENEAQTSELDQI